jgi:hypothetical protein
VLSYLCFFFFFLPGRQSCDEACERERYLLYIERRDNLWDMLCKIALKRGDVDWLANWAGHWYCFNPEDRIVRDSGLPTSKIYQRYEGEG